MVKNYSMRNDFGMKGYCGFGVFYQGLVVVDPMTDVYFSYMRWQCEVSGVLCVFSAVFSFAMQLAIYAGTGILLTKKLCNTPISGCMA